MSKVYIVFHFIRRFGCEGEILKVFYDKDLADEFVVKYKNKNVYSSVTIWEHDISFEVE